MFTKISYKIVHNRANRLKKDGTALIQIELRQNNKRVYFSTHVYVKPDDFSNGYVINHPMKDEYNFYLHDMRNRIERMEIDYLKRGIYPTLSMMKTAVMESATPSATFRDFGTGVVSNSERVKRTINGYATLFNSIDKFRSGVLLSEVDYDFITKYDLWLKNKGISHNTRVGRLRQIKAVLNEAVKRDIIQKNPFDMFKIPPMINRKGFLSAKDMKRMETLILDDKEALVRDSFLFCCYTGLRFSDFKTLTKDCIKNGWLSKVMIKTKFKVEIPIDEVFDGKAMDMVERYGGDITKLSKAIGSNATVNKILKSVFHKAKVNGEYTFHTSRHTFASLLLQIGVPVTSVQKMLGHQKISTTQIYGEVDRETITRDIRKVLKNTRKKNEKSGITD